MDKGKLQALQYKVKSHYNLNRMPTEEEVKAEIEMLSRRKVQGLGWDDSQGLLAAMFETGLYPIEL